MESGQIVLYSLLVLMVLLSVRKTILKRSLNNYTGAEAKEKMRSGSVMLDVRTSGERRSLSIPSSIHIPLQELSSRMKDLERYRGKEIICYCASGNRSVSAAMKLKKVGFTVGNLTGGITSWNF
jgi:rhodanese-related sulfurtransferase